MQLLNEIRFDNLRGDIFGGVTAAIIALPMALAFGVASGAGPAAGLYGAVLVGLFATLFGSTPTLISEPTGPMTVIITAVIASLIAADPEQGMAMAFTVVMLAGVFQMIFGALKLGRYVTMMPYTVISGFMTGIGVILIILQLGPILGQAPPPGGVIGTISSLPDLIAAINPAETALAVLTFSLIIFFPKTWGRYLPPQLVALVVATLVAVWFLQGQSIRQIGPIPMGLPELQLPYFSLDQWQSMVVDAIMLAVLGSIDALLTSVIAENLTQRQSNSDKELLGQGIGNLFAGLFGGIPGAGATMGTVVNIQAGARSALSGITRALILLIVLLWAAKLTAHIPLAVLAGIAIKVGMDIIDWSFLKRAHHVSTRAALMMYGVILLTVFVDLITAVAIGVFIANLLTIERMVEIQSQSLEAIRDHNSSHRLTKDEQVLMEQAQGKVLVFALGGPLIFGVAKAISRQYAILTDHQVLIVDFTEVPLLGVSSSLAIEQMILEDLEKSRPVFVVGLQPSVRQRLEKMGILQQVGEQNILTTRQEALERANIILS
jgi:SulP family sulfate permease